MAFLPVLHIALAQNYSMEFIQSKNQKFVYLLTPCVIVGRECVVFCEINCLVNSLRHCRKSMERCLGTSHLLKEEISLRTNE